MQTIAVGKRWSCSPGPGNYRQIITKGELIEVRLIYNKVQNALFYRTRQYKGYVHQELLELLLMHFMQPLALTADTVKVNEGYLESVGRVSDVKDVQDVEGKRYNAVSDWVIAKQSK